MAIEKELHSLKAEILEEIHKLAHRTMKLEEKSASPPPGPAAAPAGPASGRSGAPTRIVFVDMKERAGGSAKDDGDGKVKSVKSDEIPATGTTPAIPGDPLFRAVEAYAHTVSDFPNTITHVDGKLSSQQGAEPGRLERFEKRIAAIYGVVERDGATNPKADGFVTAMVQGVAEYSGSYPLYDAVLDVLIKVGPVAVLRAVNGNLVQVHEIQVRADWWMQIARTLHQQSTRYNDPHLDEMVTNLLVSIAGPGGQGLDPSNINIVIPDFDSVASNEIIKENLEALQALHFCAMMEQVKAFAVVDKILELFMQGMLPIVRGPAGDILYKYWKGSNDRMSEPERRSLYARVFGYPGGNPNEIPNREHADLTFRFVSSVSTWYRHLSLSKAIDPDRATTFSQEKMRRTGRDLAANLSLHGYGIAHFVATDLQGQLNDMKRLLSDPEIKNAFGARDMFQVIEQVAAMELGGAENTVRYRTLANAGAVIIRWLANHRTSLASASLARLVNETQILSERSAFDEGKIFTEPTDYDLVSACEQYLAVTGTTESKVDEFSESTEPPLTTSRPIQIPAAAREALDSFGISAGLGMNGRNKTYRNGHAAAAHSH